MMSKLLPLLSISPEPDEFPPGAFSMSFCCSVGVSFVNERPTMSSDTPIPTYLRMSQRPGLLDEAGQDEVPRSGRALVEEGRRMVLPRWSPWNADAPDGCCCCWAGGGRKGPLPRRAWAVHRRRRRGAAARAQTPWKEICSSFCMTWTWACSF